MMGYEKNQIVKGILFISSMKCQERSEERRVGKECRL